MNDRAGDRHRSESISILKTIAVVSSRKMPIPIRIFCRSSLGSMKPVAINAIITAAIDMTMITALVRGWSGSVRRRRRWGRLVWWVGQLRAYSPGEMPRGGRSIGGAD